MADEEATVVEGWAAGEGAAVGKVDGEMLVDEEAAGKEAVASEEVATGQAAATALANRELVRSHHNVLSRSHQREVTGSRSERRGEKSERERTGRVDAKSFFDQVSRFDT